MSLTPLADAVLADATLTEAMGDAKAGLLRALDLTGPEALRPFVVAGLVRAGRTVLAVTPTSREAEDLVAQLADLVDPTTVGYYPSWETLPHERLSPRSDTVGRRLAVLRRICHPGDNPETGPLSVVVAPVRSVLQPQVKGLGDLTPVELAPGTEAELDDVVRRLVEAAYTRVDLVEKRGEFAVRGGIVDVFPPTEEHPLRVEFWGDEVEEIRAFAVADQRALEKVERLWAPPCRELLLTDEVRRRAWELGEAHPALLELTDKISQGIAVEGMESLAPALVDEMELLVDLMPADTHVLVLDPERARARAHDLVATSDEFLGASWAAAAGGGTAPIDLGAASYRSLTDVRTHSLERDLPWWSLSPFGIEDEPVSTEPLRDEMGEIVSVDIDVEVGAVPSRALGAKPADTYRGDMQRAISDMKGWLGEGYRVAVVHPGHGPAQRMVELLGENDVPARLELGSAWTRDVVTVDCGGLTNGFVDPVNKLALLTGDDLSGQKASTRDMRKMPTRRKRQIDPLELSAGDYVVHEQHGVGRFVEMRQREVHGRDPRVPRARVRRLQARRAARPPLRPGRRPGPGDEVRRRRAAQPGPARRLRLGQAQGPRPQGGARDRGRADQAVRRPAGHQGLRLRPRHPVAARARGRVPVHRDARPAEHRRRGEGRHAPGGPDGPAGLRRRGLRQDRDRGARGVQGGAGRQAGRGARADHAARPAAPLDVRGADGRLPGHAQGAEPVPDRQGGPRGRRRACARAASTS